MPYCTCRVDFRQYSQIMMNPRLANTMYLAMGWALVVCGSAFSANLTRRGWVVAGCLALLPTLSIARFWNHAVPSLSRSIQDDLR